MARYKDYTKGDNLASIRMYGWIDKDKGFYFKYEVILEDYIGDEKVNEERIPFSNSTDAIKYVENLGYKEW